MKKMKLRLSMLFLFGVGIGLSVQAQQDSQFTQYMYNTISINPAYAGSRDALSINTMYRTQWIGLEGAPKTGNLSLNTPLTDRLGMGVSVLNEKIGPSNENDLSVGFSYNLEIAYNYRLFFGVSGSANLLNVDFSKLAIGDNLDPNFQYNIDSKFSPNVGAGVYLQSDRAYVGVSIPYILETTHYDDVQTSNVKEKMTTYFMGGYVFDLSYDFKFKPAVLTKLVSGAPLQVDLSANFMYNEKFTLGVGYRWDAAVSALAGFQVTPGLMVGYAYDFDTTNMGNYNSGSHEVFLRFELFPAYKSVASARFF